jgi:altronate dehydratase
VGTRNYIVVMATTSRTNSFCREVVARVRSKFGAHLHSRFPHVDGIVVVAHTEGSHGDGTGSLPHNAELVIRTLCGFIVHPNVGAVVAVDVGDEAINNAHLKRFLEEHAEDYLGMEWLPHRFFSLCSSQEKDLANVVGLVEEWLPLVNNAVRTSQPLSSVKLALQCGGSDAFSGVSANPLAGWVAKELVRHGGMAGLAETDELIGAESYLLRNVRDVATARKFLATVDRFKQRVALHGDSAEGNPSGGNKMRGLYNIILKSLGASVKRDPEVRLDYVIEYGELMKYPGYYFMDSPGNDLESIAGQVASGATMIFFTTGNGSITNFPFVPTVKIVTTTARFRLLSNDMDVNAGAYLDGVSMEELGRETFDLMVRVASGQKTAGEVASHSQVQIWRNWAQADHSQMKQLAEQYARLLARRQEKAHGVLVRQVEAEEVMQHHTAKNNHVFKWQALTNEEGILMKMELLKRKSQSSSGSSSTRTTGKEKAEEAENEEISFKYVREKVGLILPTSLCSGQVAEMIAQKLNAYLAGEATIGDEATRAAARSGAITRFVALPHTEGCGCGGGGPGVHPVENYLTNTLLGYLFHPSVERAVLLEHGCEKNHNDSMMHNLTKYGQEKFGLTADAVRPLVQRHLGWASVQLDGGIDLVSQKVLQYFIQTETERTAQVEGQRIEVGLSALRLGLVCPSYAAIPSHLAKAFGLFTRLLIQAKATVVIPSNSGFLADREYTMEVLDASEVAEATLDYGETFVARSGLHIMHCPSSHWIETLTGVGATGVDVMLGWVPSSSRPLQTNPLVPLIQVTQKTTGFGEDYLNDFDLVLSEEGQSRNKEEEIVPSLLQLVLSVVSDQYRPKLFGRGNADFQITRGEVGVSL